MSTASKPTITAKEYRAIQALAARQRAEVLADDDGQPRLKLVKPRSAKLEEAADAIIAAMKILIATRQRPLLDRIAKLEAEVSALRGDRDG
jgi:hypothetical protein